MKNNNKTRKYRIRKQTQADGKEWFLVEYLIEDIDKWEAVRHRYLHSTLEKAQEEIDMRIKRDKDTVIVKEEIINYPVSKGVDK